MNLPCEVIRDLLPLYAENLVSAESRGFVETHLAGCARCRAELQAMTAQTPDVQFRMDTAQEFAKYEKKKKRRLTVRTAAITAAALCGIFLLRIVLTGGAMALLTFGGLMSEPSVDTDPMHYADYMGAEAKEEYRSKWGMDERIFPSAPIAGLHVQEYKMVYYDPWDAQYLSYLTVHYSPEDYAAETARLSALGVSDYIGYYGVTGFAGAGDPLAMAADAYQGFVYAIGTPGQENTITYVELIFCNYYYDLDYQSYIPAEYLPEGFDAALDNAYQKQHME